MREILLATKNEGKIRELTQMAEGIFKVQSLNEFPGLPTSPETGETFYDNALQKARFYFDLTGIPCLADDSGLEVNALDGGPGVYSARFLGAVGDEEKNRVIIANLFHEKDKRARFVCGLIYYDGTTGEQGYYFQGELNGTIADKPRGKSGFGYDPILIPDGYDKTVAELGQEVKNEISHRRKAMSAFVEHIRKESENEAKGTTGYTS